MMSRHEKRVLGLARGHRHSPVPLGRSGCNGGALVRQRYVSIALVVLAAVLVALDVDVP